MQRKNSARLPEVIVASAFFMGAALSGAAWAQAPLVLVQPCFVDGGRPWNGGAHREKDFPIERIYPRAGTLEGEDPECYDANVERVAWKLLYYLSKVSAAEKNYLDRNVTVYITSPQSEMAPLSCVRKLQRKAAEYMQANVPAGCPKPSDGAGANDACGLFAKAIARIKDAEVRQGPAADGEIEIGLRSPTALKIGDEERPAQACGPRASAPVVLRCGILGSDELDVNGRSMLYEVARIPLNSGTDSALERVAADLLSLHASLRNLPATEPEPSIVLYAPDGFVKIKKALVRAAEKLTPPDGVPECGGAEPASKQCVAGIRKALAWIRATTPGRSLDRHVRIVLETKSVIAARWVNDIVRHSSAASCAKGGQSASPAQQTTAENLPSVYFPYEHSTLDDRECGDAASKALDEPRAAICRSVRDLERIVISRVVQAAALENSVRVRLVGHASLPKQLPDGRNPNIERVNRNLAADRANSVQRRIKERLADCATWNDDCQRARERLILHSEGEGANEHSRDQSNRPNWHFQRVDVILEIGGRDR